MRRRTERRFTVLDLLLIVAALGAGAATIRPATAFVGLNYKVFREVGPAIGASGLLFADFVRTTLECMTPWLASASLALWLIRLRPPRPRLARVMRQPGMAASTAALAVVLAKIASGLLALLLVRIPINSENFFHLNFLSLFDFSGGSVAATWICMALARARRPEANWIDRAGRVVGWCWIVSFLLIIWINDMSSYRAQQAMHPSPAEVAAQQQREQEIRRLAEEGPRVERDMEEAMRAIERLEREMEKAKESERREGSPTDDAAPIEGRPPVPPGP